MHNLSTAPATERGPLLPLCPCQEDILAACIWSPGASRCCRVRACAGQSSGAGTGD